MSERLEETHEYLLGTDPAELERLRFQHLVWVGAAHELFERAGLAAGMHVLDLGCGPGFTTLELAHVVGPSGRVLAVDQSARFLGTLRQECLRLGLTQVESLRAPVETLALPAGSLDAAYARWLFCWLAEPADVLARVARALRPGGVLVLQEYVDWAAMQLFPRSAAFARGVEACMEGWREGGATIDFAAELPALAPRVGLVLEHLRPRARLGRAGSPEWRWLDQFYRLHGPRLVERGVLGADELTAWLREWDERTAAGTSWVATPTVADAILRKR
jgi:SAM-dependent methyltransferase